MSDSRFTAATKYDAAKPPMDLVPWEAMQAVSQVLDFGRIKYSAHNWRKGFEWSRLTAAALRHIFAWLSGEEDDPESGLSHIAHAICCLMFLIAHIESELGKDDRAHKLLGAPQIPAAHVPRHKNKGYRLWRIRPDGSGCWSANDTAYTSRDVAQRAINEHFPGNKAEYEIREVEIDT